MDATRLAAALRSAWAVRAPLHDAPDLTAYRVVDGTGDGLRGVYVDRYGPAVVLSVYEDARLTDGAVTQCADTVLALFGPHGIESVYVKRFLKDRSRLGGQAPEESRSPTPRAGRPQPETLSVREYASQYEVRPFDGFSTGLFLEHREHRRWLPSLQPRRALNLFAYTCAFAVPLAASGTHVTNVDVSSRYLDWGRHHASLNAVPPDLVRFYRMDALEYLAYAARHSEERFDLIILDPPTFAAGDPRKGRRAWKALSDYPELVRAAMRVLTPGGAIFAATNARELAAPDVLAGVVVQGLRRAPAWKRLPPWPIDVREPARVAAVLFEPR